MSANNILSAGQNGGDSRTPASPIGRYRWVICSLLFFATTINYMDRAVLGFVEPVLRDQFHWTAQEYGWVTSAFSMMYGLGFLGAGWLIDRVGVRLGFSISVIFWSLAAMSHGLARSVGQFAFARGALGLAESGNFPVAIKAVAQWFPKKERALATGIFNAGANVGIMIVPILIPYVMHAFGWQSAFYVTGAFGLLWLAFWIWIYREPEKHLRMKAAELAYIRQDEANEPHQEKVKWLTLLKYRQTWAFGIGKLLTDPAWWFVLFWLSPILHDRFGLKLSDLSWKFLVVYVMADIGSVLGGWMSGRMLKAGFSDNVSRKGTMLVCAILVVPIAFAAKTNNVWVATVLIGLAMGAHQGWSCNLFTLVPDMFPRRAVGSVVGIGGFLGALGSTLFQPLVVGQSKDVTGNYMLPLFIISGVYLFALLIIHLLVPRLEPAKL